MKMSAFPSPIEKQNHSHHSAVQRWLRAPA